MINRPPSADGLGKGTALALAVHAGLVVALAWGVHWRRHDATPVAAELWAAVPQLADAPAPPPPPPAPPAPQPKPRPAPEPPPPPPNRDADIAREKRAKEAKAREEAERKEAERKAAEKREADKKADEKKKADAKAAQDKADKAEKAAQDKADAERAKRLREDQMRRLNAQLGTGTASAAGGATGGTAARSGAPSASYGGRIKARIKPNVIYSGSGGGNPKVEIEIRVGSDGTIQGSRVTKPSGVPEWDQAILRAIERTAVLPRDVDGTVPPVIQLIYSFDEI